MTFLEQYAFVSCQSLKTVHLPKTKTVDAYAFQFSGIEELDLPQATQIGRMTFQDCKLLKRLNLPSMTKADVEANVSEWKIGQNYENDCTITCFGGETVVVQKS